MTRLFILNVMGLGIWAAVFTFVIKRRIWVLYPVFFTAVTVSFLGSVFFFLFFWGRYYLDHYWTDAERFRGFMEIYVPLAWASTFFVGVPLGYAVVYEIMRRQLYSHPALRKFALFATVAVGLISAVFAWVTAQSFRHLDQASSSHEYTAAERTFTYGHFILLCAVIVISFALRIPWPKYLLGIAAGCATQSGSVLVMFMLMTLAPPSSVTFGVQTEIDMLVRLIAPAAWVMVLYRQKRGPEVGSAEFGEGSTVRHWNNVLEALLVRFYRPMK